MFLRPLDLTTALRPLLYDDETLLFVQDGVGLYEGKFKIPNYQNGHAYLTSHRVCYVDNEDPRKFSVAVDIKDIDRPEFYAGFLKSSPKVTLFAKLNKKSPAPTKPPAYPSSAQQGFSSDQHRSAVSSSPKVSAEIRDANATWICPICGLSNQVPSNFDPATANQHTPLPPCKACGIKPPLVHMVKAAIAALSNRTSGTASGLLPTQPNFAERSDRSIMPNGTELQNKASNQCPRCTFQNHRSLRNCEVCGAQLHSVTDRRGLVAMEDLRRAESPGPNLSNGNSIFDDTSVIETIKFSFRAGGEKTFFDKLNGALVQRKWLLQSAPPVPKPISIQSQGSGSLTYSARDSSPATPSQRVVGIAGLEQRGAELRQNNQTVLGTAFEDLEALMTSAKEVIQMAEQFAKQNGDNSFADARLVSDSASALGLMTTKDMLGSGSAAEQLYVTELSRDLAEFLTDDQKGILRKEGGILSLVDLWQVFNRQRNGIELVSPLDFQKAANMWDRLDLPVRLRRFKSGLLVVQEKIRTDDKTIASLLSWLREPQFIFPPPKDDFMGREYGRGVTAQETAERFGWSIGVATEELEMAEDTGVLCRDQCLDGIRFWENAYPQAITRQ